MTTSGISIADYEQYYQDTRYFVKNWEQLKEKYSGCYVAVFKGEIRAASSDLAEVIDELKRNGIPNRSTTIRYVSKEPLNLVV